MYDQMQSNYSEGNLSADSACDESVCWSNVAGYENGKPNLAADKTDSSDCLAKCWRLMRL